MTDPRHNPDEPADVDPDIEAQDIEALEDVLSRYRWRPRPWEPPRAVDADEPATRVAPDGPAGADARSAWPATPDAPAGRPPIRPATSGVADEPATSDRPTAPDEAMAPDGPAAASRPGQRSDGGRGTGAGPGPMGRLVMRAAAVLVLALFALDAAEELLSSPPSETGADVYALRSLAGRPVIEGPAGRREVTSGEVRSGERLVCDAGTRARLAVPGAGSVELGPGSRLLVDATGAGGPSAVDEAAWRLYLERGEMTASIFAAPRLFQVGTPSGLAVDMGCVYTARVDDSGRTRLSVRGGMVTFETADRKVWVPAGASVVAEPGRGPGTPVRDEMPEAVHDALARIDRLRDAPKGLAAPDRQALDRVCAAPDTLTLWHLLAHPVEPVRAAAAEALASVRPPPGGVTVAAAVAGDETAREAWRIALRPLW